MRSPVTSLILSRSNEEAKELVREAFRRTEGITEIQEGGRQIVGKTGIQFPRVLWSYGESVYVDVSDTESDDEVQLDVWAEKEVWMNITASPEDYKRRFLTEVEELRGTPIEEVAESSQQTTQTEDGQTSNVGQYVGYVVAGAIGFSILGVLLGFRLLPPRYPALGILTIGGAIGFGAADERDLPLPKRGASMVGYAAFSYLGGLLFPPPGTRLPSNAFVWAILVGMVGGTFVWYVLRNGVITDAFE